MIIGFYILYILLIQCTIKQIYSERVYGCTINSDNRQSILSNKTSVILSCTNNGYILVQHLTFGVHKSSNSTCSYQRGDCTTVTTYIGAECNGQKNCSLDLNSQYLHKCSQYSDYMVVDYLCLQGESLSICDNRLISTSEINLKHHLLIRSPNYPNEYGNSLNCSCEIDTKKSDIQFLDFYLEERDEMNSCTRDYLQVGYQPYCDSTINQTINLNSSIHLIFKTNDVITRRGFWLMINSDQSIQISCKNSFESPFRTILPLTTTIYSTSFAAVINSSDFHSTRHYTFLFLVLPIIVVVVVALVNLLLIILYWRQRRSKQNINSKTNDIHSPCFYSESLSISSSSFLAYGVTSILTSFDTHKRQTTTNGTYENLNELLTLQTEQKLDLHYPLYLQSQPELKPFFLNILPPRSTNTAFRQMIKYPVSPIHCHFSTSPQTGCPPHSNDPVDSVHIYETIQDDHCHYQQLATILRHQKQQQEQCIC